MTARCEAELPVGDDWWFEPHWSGIRCLVHRARGEIEMRDEQGRLIGSYFPEVVAALVHLHVMSFALDGVLTRPGHHRDDLYARLDKEHEAVAREAVRAPAQLRLVDMLMLADGTELTARPFSVRRKSLFAFSATSDASPTIVLSEGTRERQIAEAWLKGEERPAVVAKRWTGSYEGGRDAMVVVRASAGD